MSRWELGTVRLNKRVSVEIHLDCGGDLTPSEVDQIGVLLRGIAKATQKWRTNVSAAPKVVVVTPETSELNEAVNARQ